MTLKKSQLFLHSILVETAANDAFFTELSFVCVLLD